MRKRTLPSPHEPNLGMTASTSVELPDTGLPSLADAELVLGTHANADVSVLAPWESRIVRLGPDA